MTVDIERAEGRTGLAALPDEADGDRNCTYRPGSHVRAADLRITSADRDVAADKTDYLWSAAGSDHAGCFVRAHVEDGWVVVELRQPASGEPTAILIRSSAYDHGAADQGYIILPDVYGALQRARSVGSITRIVLSRGHGHPTSVTFEVMTPHGATCVLGFGTAPPLDGPECSRALQLASTSRSQVVGIQRHGGDRELLLLGRRTGVPFGQSVDSSDYDPRLLDRYRAVCGEWALDSRWFTAA